jgi:type I restriction enzyme R subunit
MGEVCRNRLIMPKPTESTFEQATIQRLQALGYRHIHGRDLERALHQVALVDELRDYLQRRYRHLPADAIEQAVRVIASPEGLTLDRRNLHVQRLLREGHILRYEVDGEERFEHIYFLDFENHQPELNNFLVVDQLTVQGAAGGGPGNTRRTDLIVYVNGLPLVLFELKNPWSEYADVGGAYNQIGHYVNDIPQLFNFNAFCVISDGSATLHGMYNAGFEWFSPWKSIDGVSVEPAATGSMKTLIEGLFPKARLLDYVRNYIVHEVVNDRITKKGARYHQYFAVTFAARNAVEALRPGGDRRVGVIWHTQGAGKSLSMVFLTGILRRWPGLNPTIVAQVDRNDLDNQLYDTFVAARELVGEVHQADSVENLRALLQTQGGEVICSTIEKFRRREGETRHPILSERHNILVMADEAHRTQYNLLDGFAASLRQALPNASYIGFTGTPIDQEDANTVQLFGDLIHTYDMQQAREDKAVLGLFYEARHIPLDLENPHIDDDLAAITEETPVEMPAEELEQAKAKWAAMERAAGARRRLTLLARDLLDHFLKRQEALQGKAMVVCMSRRNAVALYDALTALPGCPEVKVVMTGDLAKDPPAWSQAGHITTKRAREAIKARFVDPDDPLQIVIVVDMWLTGFDAPCANTLYIDKPMRGHNLMQAIARVNRIFRDKPAGLIVDYIGIADQLRAATRKYTAGGGRGTLVDDLARDAVEYFLHQLEVTRSNLPPGQPYARWTELSPAELEDLTNRCYASLVDDEERLEDFLRDEHALSKAFSLVRHLPAGEANLEEVAFYQALRKQLRKLKPAARQSVEEMERAVRDLLDVSITAQPAVDIFAVSGLETPDISILDEEFLAGFREREHQDLQARLLEKLLRDDLAARRRQNLVRYRSFQQMLDEAITRYNNRTIEAADVVQTMVEIRRKQAEDERRKQELGLSDEELAFYDVIAQGAPAGLPTDNEWIASLVHDVVWAVKGNVKVDWTRAHRRDVYASVESAVKRVLRRRGVKGEQFRFLSHRLMQQAEAAYEDWPLAA